ncbi:hypothetical protein DAEQUDRAFT_679624 [Daedalea quercina L-15889]|uniref:Uncharacterized protein n=1 Tax=Daedalea quercina L-15889 TaxID=1314783 RepID=A0A165L0Z6_9APHY|nr:hypothetical protein DAEQUDRAFT_679624 [Daedalea quercina L-15889]
MMIWRIINWLYLGSSQKSASGTECMVHEVILAKDFCTQNLVGFWNPDLAGENGGDQDSEGSSALLAGDGWWEAAIKVDILTGSSEPGEHMRAFSIPGLRYCKLTEIIKATFAEPIACCFHLFPFLKY